MRMIKLTGWIFFLFISFEIFAVNAYPLNHTAKSDRFTTLYVKISELNQDLKKQQSVKKDLLQQSDKLAEKILQEKLKSEGKSSRKLDSMLSESQGIVSKLESVTKRIEAIEKELSQEYSTAIASLVNQLEKESKENKKKVLLKQLLVYINSYERLMEPMLLQMPKIDLAVNENDTPQEIRRKTDFLSDQAILLKARMFQIDVQVDKLEKDKELHEKVKRFADEINFFDNALFIEEKKVAHIEPENPDIPPDEGPPLLGAEIGSVENPSSSITYSESPGSSYSGMILSNSTIDNQILLLKQQKMQFEKQIHQLTQQIQIFNKRADELGLSESQ